MKTFLSLSKFSILLSVLLTASAVAQVGRTPGGAPFAETVPGAANSGAFQPANSSMSFMTQLTPKFPGNIWASYVGASRGLGWNTGGYFSLGAKTRLGTDLLDGRWLVEARGHLAHQQGNVFGNLGVERIFTITPAKTDVGVNFFVDADGDSSRNFGHNFWSLGVGGYLRHEKFVLRGNGYIPIGTSGYRLGDPNNCFYQNFIIQQPGIDSALSGFDVELSVRPWTWQMLQGVLDVGGYYYHDPDENRTGINSFGGVRVRGRVITMRGVSIQAEYNYDQRFKATLIGRIVISSQIFGQYGPLGRDLNRTIRNDHIVKAHQDVTFLANPATNRPYRVLHVDNTAAPGGDGTVEHPFDQLADVDPLQGGKSVANDIIFVSEGDGTFRNYDTGITLQDRQYLLGDGAVYSIPTVSGQEFQLCTNADGNKPLLTNINGGPVVTLADANFVAGVAITGNNGFIKSSDGIYGANSPSGVTIRNTMIMDMADDGIDIVNVGNDIEITGNMITNTDDQGITLGSSGIAATGHTVDISNNTISDTGLDLDTGEQGHGISLANVTAGGTTFLFENNNLTDIGGDALRITDVSGTGFNTWMFNSNTIQRTGTAAGSMRGEGIFVSSVAGPSDTFMFFNNDVRQAALNGIFLDDITDDTSLASYVFMDNTAALNSGDGIRLTNFDGASVLFDRTQPLDPTELMAGAPILFTTSQNQGDGIHIANYRNGRRATDPTAIGLALTIRNQIADTNQGNGIYLESIDGDALIEGAGVTFTDPVTAMVSEFGITNNSTNGIYIRNFTNSILGTSIDVRPIIVDPMDRTMDIDTILARNGDTDTAIRVELLDGQTPVNAVGSTLEGGRFTTKLNVTESIFDANGGGISARVTGVDNNLQVSMTDMKRINNHRNDIVKFDSLNGASGNLTVRDNLTMVDNNVAGGDFLNLTVDSGSPVGPQTNLEVTAVNNLLTATGVTPGMPIPAGTAPSIGGAGLNVHVNNVATLDVTFTNNSFDGLGRFGVTMDYNLTNAANNNTFVISNNTFNTPISGDGIRLKTSFESRVAGTFANNTIFDVNNSAGINIDAEGKSTLRVQVLNNTLEDRGRMVNPTTGAITSPGLSEDGIFIRSRNEAVLLARVFGNHVTNFGGAGNLNPTAAQGPNPNWGRGINIIKDDASIFNVLVEKNSVTGSALEGLRIFSTQNNPPTNPTFQEFGGTMTALVIDNSLMMNDVSMIANGLVKAPDQQDFLGETQNNSELCLTLAGNSSSWGYVVGRDPNPPNTPGGTSPMYLLEEGANDLDTRQDVQRPNGTVEILDPPTVETLYTTPAASTCVDRYNTEVDRLDGVFGDIIPGYPTFP